MEPRLPILIASPRVSGQVQNQGFETEAEPKDLGLEQDQRFGESRTRGGWQNQGLKAHSFILLIIHFIHSFTDFNECVGCPCANNGTCVDLIADFSCICDDAWTGENCSIGMYLFVHFQMFVEMANLW